MSKLKPGDPHFDFISRTLESQQIEEHSLAGDASARKYCRITVGDTSYVLMIWEPFDDVANYPFLNVLGHMAKHNVHVPKVIGLSNKEGLVLLEDLGDLTLERKFWESQNPEMAFDFYKLAVDEIAKIHYPCTKDRNSGCVAFKIEFNTERLLWEMNYAREHLLEKFLQLRFNEHESGVLQKSFTDVAERLHREPKYLAHRDYHSRNLMIKTGRMRVIDFQDARLGPVQYDLVSLLRDSYVDMKDDLANRLIDYYLQKRKEFGEPAVNREQFDHIYELQSIQRCFKACGSFASFFNMRNDTRYLKYIRPTLARVRGALLHFPEYRELTDLLTDRGLFDREILNT